MVGLLTRAVGEEEAKRSKEMDTLFKTGISPKVSKKGEEDIGVGVEAIEAVGEVEGASIRTIIFHHHLQTLWPIFLLCLPPQRVLNQAWLNLLTRLSARQPKDLAGQMRYRRPRHQIRDGEIVEPEAKLVELKCIVFGALTLVCP